MKGSCGFSAGAVFVCFLKVLSHFERLQKKTNRCRMFAVCSLTVRLVYLHLAPGPRYLLVLTH